MSIKRTFNGATLIKPGVYSKVIVENLSGFPPSETGIVAIVGEAIGGEPGVLDILQQEEIQAAKARYKSGNIADALELLVNPSKDPRIPNGASKIIVYKVNDSTQSSVDLDQADSNTVITLNSKNYGADENNLNVSIAESTVTDLSAVITGTVAGPFNLAGSETLILVSKSVTYTFTNTLTGAAVTAAALVTELNTAARWSTSTKPVIASQTSNLISLTIDPTVVTGGELDYGYLSVTASSTLDTIIGATGINRGRKGGRILTFTNGAEQEVTPEIGGVDVFTILYTGAGTLATMTIQMSGGAMKLTTACTGAAGDNLDLTLVDSAGVVKYTMKQLVDLINANASYTATMSTANYNDLDVDELDYYNAVEIRLAAMPVRRDVHALYEYLNTFSDLVEAEEREDNVYEVISTISSGTPTFFAGGTDGTSTNSDWSDAFEALKQERVNVVVPLLSEDKGSLTIDSINALAAAHATWGWSTLGRSERAAFVSKNCSGTLLKTAAQTLANAYVSIVGHQVQVLDREGTLRWMDPWAGACVLAGLRCGAEVGEPLTHKQINVNNVRIEDESWDSKTNFAEMIEAGVTVLEPLDVGGFRVMLGNTTYGKDANFVWNRESVVQAAGYVAYDLRQNLEAVFIGTKARTGTAEAIANFVKARMTIYLENDIIVGDDLNEGLGFKNLRVVIEGNTAKVNISITPVQGIDFILPTLYLSDIRQSA